MTYKVQPSSQIRALVRELEGFRQAHPPQEAEIAGQTWKYFAGGSGDVTVFMLPGGLLRGERYFRVMSRLEQTVRVVTFDWPVPLGGAGSIEGLHGLVELMQPGKAVILGHSYGSIMTQAYAKLYRDEVDGLVLANAGAARPDQLPGVKRGGKTLKPVPSWFIEWGMTYNLKRMMGAPKDPTEAAFWRWYGKENDVRLDKPTMISMLDTLAWAIVEHPTEPGWLEDWSGEVLILESTNDKAAKPKARRALRETYPRARVHEFQGAGHATYANAVDEYVQVVSSWLETV